MKVLINPSLSEKGSGTTSFAGWDRPDVVAAMNFLFTIKDGERIEQIEVDSHGITARIAGTRVAI